MENLYPIYVPGESINEDKLEHSEMIDWCVNNLSNSSTNAVFLSLEDVYMITYNSQVLDIINEENGECFSQERMIGLLLKVLKTKCLIDY
jgi:hypothetical protein